MPNVEYDMPALRDKLFDVLSGRLGAENAVGLREDFDEHLNAEGQGLEAAYLCLCTKLITIIDNANEALLGTAEPITPPEGFTGFEAVRKTS